MGRSIEEIIEQLKSAIKKTELKISEESVFKEAMICYCVENNNSKTQNNKPTNPNQPTEKQLNLIRKHEKDFLNKGFDIQNIQTKDQATKIINDWITLRESEKKNNIKKTETKNTLHDKESSLL